MPNPKIVSILEKPWVEIKREAVFKHRSEQEWQQHCLKQTPIGRKLINVFGPPTFSNIFWSYVGSDSFHLEQVIGEVKPDLLICFGSIAEKALEKSLLAEKVPWLACHDPMEKGRTLEELCVFVMSVCEWCDEWKISGGTFKWEETIPTPMVTPPKIKEKKKIIKPWELKKYI